MVAAVAGAALSPTIILVLGVANLLADGFAMGASNYLSQRLKRDYQAIAGVVSTDDKHPLKTGFATFVAFVVAGSMPLVPYALAVTAVFRTAVAVTAVTFFVVGASRSVVTSRRWYVNGSEMLAVGMIAATVAYAVGSALGGIS